MSYHVRESRTDSGLRSELTQDFPIDRVKDDIQYLGTESAISELIVESGHPTSRCRRQNPAEDKNAQT